MALYRDGTATDECVNISPQAACRLHERHGQAAGCRARLRSLHADAGCQRRAFGVRGRSCRPGERSAHQRKLISDRCSSSRLLTGDPRYRSMIGTRQPHGQWVHVRDTPGRRAAQLVGGRAHHRGAQRKGGPLVLSREPPVTLLQRLSRRSHAAGSSANRGAQVAWGTRQRLSL